MKEAREELHTIINSEKKKGMSIKELIRKGVPTDSLMLCNFIVIRLN